MNALQQQIVKDAWKWKARNCREVSKNWGNCITEVQQAFDSRTAAKREAYCAKFAWVLLDAACTVVGVKNRLPKTAGAKNMRDKSAKVLRVNTVPAVGAVFYRFSKAPGATGHIGVMIGSTNSHMVTVEGNNEDRIDVFQYRWEDVKNPSNGFAFIHTEAMQDGAATEAIQQAGFDAMLMLGIVGAAAYMVIK